MKYSIVYLSTSVFAAIEIYINLNCSSVLNPDVYPTCDHSLARAPTLKPQRAKNATYCEGMNYAIV